MADSSLLPALLGALLGACAGAAAWVVSSRWIAAWGGGETAPDARRAAGLILFGAAVGAAGGRRHVGDAAALAALAACGPVLLFLMATDLRVKRIPAVGAAALALAGLAAAPLAGPAGWQERILGAFLGFAAAGMLWAAGRIVGRRGEDAFGGGDVLLAAGIGLAVGLSRTFPVLLAGAVGAAVAAAVMAARGQGGPLPWGAYLCAAAAVALAW